jgi:hypothetical protein
MPLPRRPRRARARDLRLESLERRIALATFLVNSVGDEPAADLTTGQTALNTITLRSAIEAANALPGADTIQFNIAGTGLQSIAPTTALPTITDPITIDATTQPGSVVNSLDVGSNAVPQVLLSGAGLPAGSDGLVFNSAATGSSVNGLVFTGFPGFAIRSGGAGGNTFTGNFFGLDYAADPTGGTAAATGGGGIAIESANNVIGGAGAGLRNVILGGGSSPAVSILSGAANQILNNYFGTNAAGTAPRGTGGLEILSSGNSVGGSATGLGNVFSTIGRDAITIGSPTETNNLAFGNQVLGNRIGVDAAGQNALTLPGGAFERGVRIFGTDRNVIGGSTPGAGNTIVTGNNGIEIAGAPTGSLGNQILGNFLGTNPQGSAALGDLSTGSGILLDSTINNIIGGANDFGAGVNAGNVIGNFANGVNIVGTTAAASGNQLLGNFIGLGAGGTSAIGNGVGVSLGSAGGDPMMVTGNLIGGEQFGVKNYIGGNANQGILVNAGQANSILGNSLGVGFDGTTPFGNGFTNGVANGAAGIQLAGGNGNILGGFNPGAGNFIGNGGGAGILATGGTGNQFLGNSFAGNALDPITLDNTLGGNPNNVTGQVPFIFNTATAGASGSQFTGGFTGGTAGGSYTAQFYTSNGTAGAPLTFLGSSTTTADAGGAGAFDASFGALPTGDNTVFALLSDADGNTSAFTQGFAVTPQQATTAADLGVTLTQANDGTAPYAGFNQTSTVNITNASATDTVSNVVVSFTLPANTTFVPPSTPPAGWTITPPAAGSNVVTATLASLAPGATAQLPLTALLASSPTINPGDVLSYSVNISAAENTDSNPDNDSASLASTVLALPTATVGDVTVTEGDAGATNAQVPITFNVPAGQTAPPSVTLTLTTLAGTAQPGIDFTPITQTVTFTAGGPTTQFVNIPILGNTTATGTRTFTVQLAAAPDQTVQLTDATGTVTIIDNDITTPPTDTTPPTVVNITRYGFHEQPTVLVIRFSEPVDPSAAADPFNYAITSAGRDGRFGTNDDVFTDVAQAAYDPTTNSVTLRLAQSLYIFTPHVLSVGGIGDLAGNPIGGDGSPTDFTLSRSQLAGRASEAPLATDVGVVNGTIFGDRRRFQAARQQELARQRRLAQQQQLAARRSRLALQRQAARARRQAAQRADGPAFAVSPLWQQRAQAAVRLAMLRRIGVAARY